MDMVYSLLRAWIRWSDVFLLTYFTTKSLTTKEKEHFWWRASKARGYKQQGRPEFCELDPEAGVGYADSLLQPGNAFLDLHKKSVIRGKRVELILDNDFFGDHVQGNPHVLVQLHRGIVGH